ncbi:MAG: glycosyltransferase [Bacteroidetes bacterium]|nr:glycosyltransferase [Bacteroidota bacterium]
MSNNLIFVGNYIDADIQHSRKLPSVNPAASNRMISLSKALASSGNRVIIVSSSSAASIGFNRRIFIKRMVIKRDSVVIVCSPTVGIPILSSVLELIFLPLTYLQVLNKIKSVNFVLLYCYYPSLVIVALISKLLRIKIIEDLQDVSSISFKYMKNLKFTEKLQQFLGFFSMKLIIKLSTKVLIPTNRFKKFIGSNKKVETISGCINNNNKIIYNFNTDEINILYSGLLNSEQGFYLFMESLKILDRKLIEKPTNLVFHISGYGIDRDSILSLTSNLATLKIQIHGFLSNEAYKELLMRMDVCLALQDPHGKNSNFKTPSKTYDYFSFAKTVIVSNVGDFKTMPNDCRILLEPYTAKNLASILVSITKKDVVEYGKNALQYASQNWSYDIISQKILS